MLVNYLTKVKSWIRENKADLYVAILIFLVGLASFGLGRLSVLWPEKEPITITNSPRSNESGAGDRPLTTNDQPSNTKGASEPAAVINTIKGKYVASRSGKAYHYPWCAGALKIKEENKIWFQTKEDAIKAGYKPAGNCEGL